MRYPGPDARRSLTSFPSTWAALAPSGPPGWPGSPLVAILSKVGDDLLGRDCLEQLRQAGMETALVQTDPRQRPMLFS